MRMENSSRHGAVSTLPSSPLPGYERPVIFVNGKFPSPTIEGEVGDRIVVEFINLLGEPASLHWHGVRQARRAGWTGRGGGVVLAFWPLRMWQVGDGHAAGREAV